MDYQSIEERIRDIEERSDEARRDTFQLASNGKFILKEELETYNQLLKNLEDVEEYRRFYEANREIIDQHLKLKAKVESFDKPLESDLDVSTDVKDVQESKADSKPEIDIPIHEDITAENKTESEEPVMLSAPKPLELPAEPIIEPTVGTYNEQYAFHKSKDEIVQDMPIFSKEEQAFNAGGLSDGEIKDSQDKLDSIVEVSPEIDPIEAEIQARIANMTGSTPQMADNIVSLTTTDNVAPQNENNYKPMTDEEIKESQEKLGLRTRDVAVLQKRRACLAQGKTPRL